MSLCSSCFTSGNHIGHDFNKFKSLAGGACDCGDPTVMLPSGYCRYHGPDKVHNRPRPPEELVAPLRCLLSHFLSALLFWFWELCTSSDPTTLTDEVAPALYILHVLHACGWVTQKMIADVLIDHHVFTRLKAECIREPAYNNYLLSVSTNPTFTLPDIIAKQDLVHNHLLDAFIFCTLKLRFPESLVTFLIGLLAVEEFKEQFVQSYLNHYTRIASTVMISARTRMVTDWSLQMNNRIVHISVQLFSGEALALRMVRERHLHYLLIHCILNMCDCCRSRLDDRSNMVINCDGPLIQNNVFWPFVSDLSNLVSHKSIVDVFVEDPAFLRAWTTVLRYMQFMNCFVLREGDHIEYETMAFYHAFTMEIEISANPMWNIWQHYRDPGEKDHCLAYAHACLSSLGNLLAHLGHLTSPVVTSSHPLRSPLSLHLPLMRHASCFLGLAVVQHGADLRQLLAEYLYPKPSLLCRFLEELANTLLGCHEVIVGYWIRNGQALRQSITHYMQSQFCYSFIDLDIFAFQVCATLLPPAYVLNTLLDSTRLLRDINFYDELLRLVAPPEARNLDRKPMALEAWLLNLCWILDIRNNICLTDDELLKKELLCVLAPEPRKRSDLSSLIPERCGITGSNKNLDVLLEKVATYSGPSCNETSGSLTSGHYFMHPTLWHTDFDPIFHSLRVTSRRESAVAMDKYREHCRQRHNVVNPSALWPPYRTPKPLPTTFLGLDHILHSRHLHFLLFIQLSLYVYGDPLVTEESLGIIIHLLDRALDMPCRTQSRRNKCCEASAARSGPTPMQVDFTHAYTGGAEDELMEFADGSDEDSLSDDVLVVEKIFPAQERRDNSTGVKSFVNLIGGRLRSSSQRSDSDPWLSDSTKSSHMPRWDASLVKCPYRPQTNLHDNLGCWLRVDGSPTPCISLAPTVLVRTDEVATSPHMLNVIPAWSASEQADHKSEVLVDNLLSLLIKAHARLHWSRVSGSSDSFPKVVIGGTCTDPNSVVAQNSPIGPTHTDELVGLAQTPMDMLSALADTMDRAVANNSSSPEPLPPRCTAFLASAESGLALNTNELTEGSNNMANGESVPLSANLGVAGNLTANLLLELPPELRYFALTPPAYSLKDEADTNSENVHTTTAVAGGEGTPCPNLSHACYDDADRALLSTGNQCTAFGDGAFWIERLLNKIAAQSPSLESAIRLYLARARRPYDSIVRVMFLQSMDSIPSLNPEHNKEELATASCANSKLHDSPSTVPYDNAGSCANVAALTTAAPGTAAITREERKRAAMERRKRLMDQMASKQKAFALVHLKDMELISQPTEEPMEATYECVICQLSGTASSDDMVLLDMMCESGVTLHMRDTPVLPELSGRCPTQSYGLLAGLPLNEDSLGLVPSRPPMPFDAQHLGPALSPKVDVPASSSGKAPTGTVGVSVLTTSFDPGSSLHPPLSHSVSPEVAASMQSPSSLPSSPSPNAWLHGLPGSTSAQSSTSTPANPSTVPTLTSPIYVESRRWWSLALPTSLSRNLPVLRSGLVLQTCGHIVHRDCFQRYRTQGSARTGPARNRVWVSCPLCRREVHHLLPLVPIHPNDKEAWSNLRTRVDHISALEASLKNLTPDGRSVWDDLNGVEDDSTVHRRALMSPLLGERFEATILLRSQLECELSVLMSCPVQYSVVSRRCSWREFLSYIRLIYRKSTDLLALLNSLTSETAPFLDEPVSGSFTDPVFALCQDPADILLTFVPHVWPREDIFLTIVAAAFTLAYVRALIGALFRFSGIRGSPCSLADSEELLSKLSGPFAEHVQHLLPLLRSLTNPLPSSSHETDSTSRIQNLLFEAARLPDAYTAEEMEFNQDQFELHVVLRMLPLLRLAALCRTRWQSNTVGQQPHASRPSTLIPSGLPFVGQLVVNVGHPQVTENLQITPEQRLLEFSDLSRILFLDSWDTTVINVAAVAELAANRSGLIPDVSEGTRDSRSLFTLMDRWFAQLANRSQAGPTDANSPAFVFPVDHSLTQNTADAIDLRKITESWVTNLIGLMEVGRQLYSPRLIRTPHSFDTLFNALHLVGCNAVQHRFQDNALCLICGRLLCALCTNLSTAMVEHAYSCEGFSGIALEVNTSIVYVCLGRSVCDWGSVYLDAYGEEDLELKRGKPLFLNAERFALLEHQWLSHSFRHVLKHWRIV
ncbi:unnamed protein product [Dicrocoelium dendriticum]|nr:unnamed protein product [Dicrocoelium dendriticum]